MAKYELASVELESPLLNAAGSINGQFSEQILTDISTLAESGIGAITVGSFTIPSQEGNEVKYGGPVYWYDHVTGKTYNSMGLPNIGLEAALALAPEIISRANGKPVIFSGSPTNSPDHGSSVRQAVRLAYDLLSTDAALVEVNVSCPNVVTDDGQRKPVMGYDLDSMAEFVDLLGSEIGSSERLGVKLPPYISDEQKIVATGIIQLFRANNVFSFLVTANTIGGQVPIDAEGNNILSVPGGMGGMSGPATAIEGQIQTVLWASNLADKLDVVSTLGVHNGRELSHRVSDLGAVAASGVSFLWNSRNWKSAVSEMLGEFAEAA